MRYPDFLRRIKESGAARKPLVEVGISRENLLHNLNAYRERYPGMRLAPVLKSNAYGHDLGLVARLLDTEGLAFFMVDSLYEAERLRKAGIRTRIVVMGYMRPGDIVRARLRDTQYAVTDMAQLRELTVRAQSPLSIHLKLDTGMHRQGIMPEDLPEAIVLLKDHPHITVTGICSHFASADEADGVHARLQLTRWNEMRAPLEETFPSIAYRHLAATKGARFAEEAGTDVIRLGIGLYGFDTSPGGVPLRPVLELRSVVGSVRTVPAGEHVGYNATHTVAKDARIATIPAGYFEGMDRRLSGKGTVFVNGIPCPIVGRVSMNMVAADVTEAGRVSPGDPVVLVSRDLEAPNSVSGIARLASGTDYAESQYVILAQIPQHLKRVLE